MNIKTLAQAILGLAVPVIGAHSVFSILLLSSLFAPVCFAEVKIPEGTKLRVRLEQGLSSATAEEGQTVELSVADAVKVGDTTVFAEGSRVTGTVTVAHEKRRLGRAGKLDFSIDRARAFDDQWIALRYSLNKKSGESHAVRTGIITAGVAVAFWPAAPFFLLMKGNDITINKGVTFDVFTDTDHVVSSAPAMPRSLAPSRIKRVSVPQGMATVSVTSSIASADIDVDGGFVGNTPTSLQLPAGQHHVIVTYGSKSWERTLQVSAGSTISLNATPQ